MGDTWIADDFWDNVRGGDRLGLDHEEEALLQEVLDRMAEELPRRRHGVPAERAA